MPRRKKEDIPVKHPAGTAYGYGRVSTLEQAQHGTSLDTQREGITRWVTCFGTEYRNGGVVTDDGVSGNTYFLDRPQGKELNAKLQPGDAIVFYKLDRAFRNMRDGVNMLDIWARRGVRVVIMDLNMDTSTPFGQAMIGFLLVVSQLERARFRERAAEAFARIKASGRKHNKGKWTNHKRTPFELKCHAWIYEKRMEGMEWRVMETVMFREHWRTPSGCFWHRERIKKGFKEECARLEKMKQAVPILAKT